ncbi:MAG: glucokinase [Spirochaetales bacterium]|nr:glucokinase [Spirochaetales bacterium]
MQAKWFSTNTNFNTLILAGDIGGTNTNLALVGEKNMTFKILLECVFSTRDVKDFLDPFSATLREFESRFPGQRPVKCCLSGAGPVENNYCRLTNAGWDIDANKIRAKTGIESKVINDFTALSYGIPLLDTANPEQITRLPRPDGSHAEPRGNTKLIIGAGTGLGVGFVTEENGRPLVFPSEGGHGAYAPHDNDSCELARYLSEKYNEFPDIEKVISGQGIVNIFNFFRDVKKIPIEGIIAEINKAPDSDKPKMISKNAATDRQCRIILDFFISTYARLASSLAATILPMGGLYLAGGIVSKDEPYYLADNHFMKSFCHNIIPQIDAIIRDVPVYIIRDYSTSIYGAANAAYWLIGDD